MENDFNPIDYDYNGSSPVTDSGYEDSSPAIVNPYDDDPSQATDPLPTPPVVIYPEWDDALRHLDDGMYRRAWLTILEYAFRGNISETDPIIRAVVALMLHRIDSDRRKYRQTIRRRSEISEKRAQAGRRGGQASAANRRQQQQHSKSQSHYPQQPAQSRPRQPQTSHPSPCQPHTQQGEASHSSPVPEEAPFRTAVMQFAPASHSEIPSDFNTSGVIKNKEIRNAYLSDFQSRRVAELEMLTDTFGGTAQDVRRLANAVLDNWCKINTVYRTMPELEDALLNALHLRFRFPRP